MTRKNCRSQKANWGDWKAVWNWLVTKRKTSNWQKLRNWQELWNWQHIVKKRNTAGPADLSHWCKLGDYQCVVDCFYIALFSALEQTHCAHTILNELLWWTHDKEHLKRSLQILKLSNQKKLKPTLEFTHKTILIYFEQERDEVWSTMTQHNQPRWQYSRVRPLSEAAAKLESNPFPSVVQSFGKGLSWQHVGKNPSLASWTDDVVVASKIGNLGKKTKTNSVILISSTWPNTMVTPAIHHIASNSSTSHCDKPLYDWGTFGKKWINWEGRNVCVFVCACDVCRCGVCMRFVCVCKCVVYVCVMYVVNVCVCVHAVWCVCVCMLCVHMCACHCWGVHACMWVNVINARICRTTRWGTTNNLLSLS